MVVLVGGLSIIAGNNFNNFNTCELSKLKHISKDQSQKMTNTFEGLSFLFRLLFEGLKCTEEDDQEPVKGRNSSFQILLPLIQA